MKSRASALKTLLVVALVVTGCDGGEGPVASGLLEVDVEIDTDNVLHAEVGFASDEESVIVVTDDAGRGFQVTAPADTDAHANIPLLGLTAETHYTVQVTSGDSVGTASFTTGGLPSAMPPIDVESSPEQMAAGLTLFDVIPLHFGESQGATDDGYLIAVDERGEVVWYYRQPQSIQDARRTDSGEILFINFETGAKSLDVIDDAVTEWSGTTALDEVTEDDSGRPYAGSEAIRVETPQMHHEIAELPNGDLVTLSRELKEVDGFPEAICDEEGEFSGSYEVVADTVVEFEPDGTVVNQWSLFDYVDPLSDLERIKPAEFCSQYLADLFPDTSARDWTHGNAVVFDQARNALLVSARHLDQILAIRYQDDEDGPAGELLWRLGDGGDFELTRGDWFVHQHAPEVLEDGTIMVYDNGNERPGTSLDEPDHLPYSRAVQYRIDAANWTAEQVWESRVDAPGEAVYAPFLGDADMLDNGNVLITHGGLLDPPAHTPQAEGVVAWGRVIEVDYDTGDILFDLRVKDPADEMSWIVYRSERIPTIYPEGYDVEPIGG